MPTTYVFEHAYYIGNYFSGILYGIELVMYFTSMRRLLANHRKSGGHLTYSRVFSAVFCTTLLILLTIDISTNAVWGEQLWITYRDSPGGVPAFIATQTSVWYETMGSSSVVAMIFMGDALLIYRLFIIYDLNYFLIVIPCLTWCASFILAIIQLVVSGKPGGNFFGGKSVDIATPYYALTIALNVVITTLICTRLFLFSRCIKRTLGPDGAKTYTSIVVILIESAAPYSLVGVMFLIAYAKQSGTAIAFGQVWAKMTCISPQLIMLGVISGTAWNKDTVEMTKSGGRMSRSLQFLPACDTDGKDLEMAIYGQESDVNLGSKDMESKVGVELVFPSKESKPNREEDTTKV